MILSLVVANLIELALSNKCVNHRRPIALGPSAQIWGERESDAAPGNALGLLYGIQGFTRRRPRNTLPSHDE